MKYSLKTFLLQAFLLSTSIGLILAYGQHRFGLIAFIAVSALYSTCLALSLNRSSSTRNGMIGAVLGWAIAFLVCLVPDFFRYAIMNDVEPTFDGEGPFMSLIVPPLIAFFYLLAPIVVMGGVIGWISSCGQSPRTEHVYNDH